jgi:alpha-N-acetylglucosaminidase
MSWMKKIFALSVAALLLVGTGAQAKKAEDPAVSAAKGVIERTLGYYPKRLTLKVVPGTDTTEFFTTEAAGGRLTVTGSSTVAVCRGFYDYVTRNHYGMLTWSVNNINLPDKFPDDAPRTVTTPFRHRQYMNVCTFGYSAPYWDWARWEKELDWMAFHGIDMPLSPIGSEAIFARVWKKLGMTDEEIGKFVTAAAYFPWFRMGNMSGLDGNLSQDYYDKTIALEHKIVDRMAELGMSPIFNAFAGFVPEALKRVCPEAKLIRTGWGSGPDYVCNYIEPTTEIYQKIAGMYLSEWEKEFGKGKYYLADSFNEMDVPFAPKGTKERFDQIANYGKTLYESIVKYNPDAVWVLQGWMLGYSRGIWDPSSIEALFSAVPDDKVIVIDLATDFNHDIWQTEYLWNYAPKVYGQSWIYSTTPNFGGRTCPVGNLDYYLNGHLNALNSPNKGRLVGIGTAPEGVENNEVIYEILSSAEWSTSHQDIRKWLHEYSVTRYGSCPPELDSFWDNMLKSAYGFSSSRAELRVQRKPYYLLGGRYDTSDEFFRGCEDFFKAGEKLSGNKAYDEDLALWAGCYAFAKADVLLAEIHRDFVYGDAAAAEALENRYKELLLASDRFFESNPLTRLQRWVDFARSWGSDDAEKDKYEVSAKRLVTTWGKGRRPDGLDDYGCKMWSGLIRDYYLPRWENYFASRKDGKPFDFDQWEYKYAEESHGVSPVEPYPDILAAAMEVAKENQDIRERTDEISGWTSFDMEDSTTHFCYMLDPKVYPSVKGLRFTLRHGDASVTLRKVQLNGAGVARIKLDNLGLEISPEHPVAEVKFDKNSSDNWNYLYLHIYIDGTTKGCDSNVSIEYMM